MLDEQILNLQLVFYNCSKLNYSLAVMGLLRTIGNRMKIGALPLSSFADSQFGGEERTSAPVAFPDKFIYSAAFDIVGAPLCWLQTKMRTAGRSERAGLVLREARHLYTFLCGFGARFAPHRLLGGGRAQFNLLQQHSRRAGRRLQALVRTAESQERHQTPMSSIQQ